MKKWTLIQSNSELKQIENKITNDRKDDNLTVKNKLRQLKKE